jgi:UTP--glucose-1-phosphate uridylyltransferase
MTISKAVIPAAGFGTRFLPASKAVPKVLLPVVDKPVIQYAVEEVVRAGVTKICVVISKGSESVVDHFRPAAELESLLEERGKVALLKEARALNELAEIEYVQQDEPLGLGHAVLIARDFIGDEPFLCALPDEIYDPAEDVPGDLVRARSDLGHSVITVTEVTPEQIGLYGSIEVNQDGEVMQVKSVVEKPEPGTAPSNYAIVGRYLLEPEIFDSLDRLTPGAGGEIQLTDSLDELARKKRLSAKLYRGRRWDAGNKEGYLQAVVSLASERPDLGPAFLEFLREFMNERS